ncbi:hypothetical protein BELL_0387g00120 [Botrytis elliptica]|uniref:Uncharacterized protein n=1 Tax=Botrytis elliptica TaxID=278938 RepID=A0A4Z1JHV5_9HELO|nr:hypothetical protein BELL_0387g00120 [Botrytis elliptica]
MSQNLSRIEDESDSLAPPCGEPDSIINDNRLLTEAVVILNLPSRPKTVVAPNSHFVVEPEPFNDLPPAPPGEGFVNPTNSLSYTDGRSSKFPRTTLTIIRLVDPSFNLPIAYVPQQPPFNRASSVPNINVPLPTYHTPILKSIFALPPSPCILVESDLTLVEDSDLEPLAPPGGGFKTLDHQQLLHPVNHQASSRFIYTL